MKKKTKLRKRKKRTNETKRKNVEKERKKMMEIKVGQGFQWNLLGINRNYIDKFVVVYFLLLENNNFPSSEEMTCEWGGWKHIHMTSSELNSHIIKNNKTVTIQSSP